jgi:hypothetical protein
VIHPSGFDRIVIYGYRYGEQKMPEITDIKQAKISKTGAFTDGSRPAVQVSLGCHVQSYAQPHVCPNDPDTIEAGVRKRFLKLPPTPNQLELEKIKEFTREFIKNNYKPLPNDVDDSVETWLKNAKYPEWRKKELLNLWENRSGKLNKRDFVVKSFVKDETYPSFKHARGINSRTDAFKCAVGPIFHLIEEQVFKHADFIKKIPVAQRAKYVKDKIMIDGAKYAGIDFVAFESHFTQEIMKTIEWELYFYMTRDLPGHTEFMQFVEDVIMGPNHCIYKFLLVDVLATRMSGEMNTSLGNGFADEIIINYIFKEKMKQTCVRTVIEGDDSLTSFFGPPPDSADFAKLGFQVKIEVTERLNEASFCGLIFDTEVEINITDPIDVLTSFGWAGSKYVGYSRRKLNSLLRCKSLSYLHQYPGCPIVQSLALYGLKFTRGLDTRAFIENDRGLSLWERVQLRAANEVGFKKLPVLKVSMSSRLLMQEMFGIDVQLQIDIEDYLDSRTELGELCGPVLDACNIFAPVEMFQYYDQYHTRITCRSQLSDPTFKTRYRSGAGRGAVTLVNQAARHNCQTTTSSRGLKPPSVCLASSRWVSNRRH